MSDLENRLDRASSGEYRLKPDEQKLYLNTYRERVLLAIKLSDAQNILLKNQFNTILNHFDDQYDTVFVKICGSLSDELSGFYLKTATEHHFQGQILVEDDAEYYGIIIHTDYAVNLDKIALAERFPEISLVEAPEKPAKKSFFSKLFG